MCISREDKIMLGEDLTLPISSLCCLGACFIDLTCAAVYLLNLSKELL